MSLRFSRAAPLLMVGAAMARATTMAVNSFKPSMGTTLVYSTMA